MQGSALSSKMHGFSLTELVIVVAIIGILAAIAYPSYQDSVRKSRRADAKAALLENAQFMERTFVQDKAYNGISCPASATAIADCELPVWQTPKDGSSQFYQISIATPTTTTYTLTATRIAGSPQANDKCGNLTVTHTGQKGLASQNTGVTVADCW